MYDAFISHKQEDRVFAELVASACEILEVTCYLDVVDASIAGARSNPRTLTHHIEEALGVSNTLLCLFTDKTHRSSWVPFEIGFTRGEGKGLAVLDGRNTASKQLPEYLVGWQTLPVREFSDMMRSWSHGRRDAARQLMVTLLHGWSLWLKKLRTGEIAKSLTESFNTRAASPRPTGANRSDELGRDLAAIYRRNNMPLGPRF